MGEIEGTREVLILERLRASQISCDREMGERLTRSFEALLDAMERSDGDESE